MAIGFDVASESHTGTTGSASQASFTWNHARFGGSVMAFAIFFEPEDASKIAGSVNAQTLPVALRNECRKYWNAGLKDWATAPVGTFPGDTSCPLCRTLVMDGPGLTLTAFIALCEQVGAFFGDDAGFYIVTLAREMAQTGRDPWPIP